jgi:hypothetical protein
MQIDTRKETAKVHIGGAIHHQAHGTAGGVLCHVDHRTAEMGVHEGRHGHEKLSRYTGKVSVVPFCGFIIIACVHTT